jgi:hypothetical protein
MKVALSSSRQAKWALVFVAAVAAAPASAVADGAGQSTIRFQKPNRGAVAAATQPSPSLKFRSASAADEAPALEASQPPAQQTRPAATTVAKVAVQSAQQASYEQAKPLAAAPKAMPAAVVRQAAPQRQASRPTFVQEQRESFEEPANYTVSEATFTQPRRRQGGLLQTNFLGDCVGCADPGCGITEPTCGCGEPTCGICEPACGIVEPGCGMEPACGIVEPGCGVVEPGCGLVEPGCGLGEPSCGCGEVGCGSCIGNPGPDYWCFPVCLPRLKEFSAWAGVHGFKGPRDVFDGAGDNNFGFQEGANIGGRAPLLGLIFPQISYQLGYQAVQSKLSGSYNGATEDRSQDFVTAGLFRRVPAGLQFGAVWDYMDDDFFADANFQQIRYEISIKSQQGREIGFLGANSINDDLVNGITYSTVDQYVGFVRLHFRGANEVRFWGGGTNDNEGLFGGDFYMPINDRWSLDSGFNYLIPQQDNGGEAATEESWNIGMNLVWHYGRTAKQARFNPHRPLFGVADNGWMFIDRAN